MEDKMGGSLNHMNKTERHAIERFGETVKSRLGEYVVRMSVFGSKCGAITGKHLISMSLLSLKKDR